MIPINKKAFEVLQIIRRFNEKTAMGRGIFFFRRCKTGSFKFRIL
nr:MAG TPA: hypothetical protein [Caudoviricetes sp.]